MSMTTFHSRNDS